MSVLRLAALSHSSNIYTRLYAIVILCISFMRNVLPLRIICFCGWFVPFADCLFAYTAHQKNYGIPLLNVALAAQYSQCNAHNASMPFVK